MRPRHVAVIGADSQAGRLILSNLRAGGFAGTIHEAEAATIARLAVPPDLAIVAAAPDEIAACLRALAARGARAAVVTSQIAGLAGLASELGLRVLGPSSFGIANTALGLNASLSHLPIPRGRVALLTQSASLCRAVIDWGGPNGVGFSVVAGIGGNADIGFARLLDVRSRDPDTALIMMDIRLVRERRMFISAARAASRLRPVVALRPGGRVLDPSGRAEAVFCAALRRAGVFAVSTMQAFLAAAETLSRARPLRGETVAVVTNAIGPGRLAADAALAGGIGLAVLPPDTKAALTGILPAELTRGLIYTGSADPIALATIAASLSAVPGIGGLLLVLAPTGEEDAAAIEAVIAAASVCKMPLLTCVMGETTGAGYHRRLAEAGLPAFATPEEAVEGFGHLLHDRHARQAARELPSCNMLDISPDRAGAHAILAEARARGALAVPALQAGALLGCFGLSESRLTALADAVGGQNLAIDVQDDPVFGPAIGIAGASGGSAAYELPPLNLSLAHALAARAGFSAPRAAEAVADTLVRLSQMLVDLPELATVRLAGQSEAGAFTVEITLRPPGDMAKLAIAPYPDHLAEAWTSRGERFLVRPIRPEDAAAHAALVGRVPQDDLRYRFFTPLHAIAPEQMARLTQIDYDREMALIAVRESDGATVGVARLLRELDESRGEFAILVQPDMKGRGLATHLMQRLFGWARSQGIAIIAGQVLADNRKMLDFVRGLGFTTHAAPDDPELVEVQIAL